LARSGVRGTLSQPGPSHPAASGRLARTLCRTKCPHADSQMFQGTVSAHRRQKSVSRGAFREFMHPQATLASDSNEREDKASNRESGTLRRPDSRNSSRQATSRQGQNCGRGASSSRRLRAAVQGLGQRAWCSPRLAQRAAGPLRSPQRRSTAPALLSAETGRLPWHAQRKTLVFLRANTGAA
jgi:hypothetical protein